MKRVEGDGSVRQKLQTRYFRKLWSEVFQSVLWLGLAVAYLFWIYPAANIFGFVIQAVLWLSVLSLALLFYLYRLTHYKRDWSLFVKRITEAGILPEELDRDGSIVIESFNVLTDTLLFDLENAHAIRLNGVTKIIEQWQSQNCLFVGEQEHTLAGGKHFLLQVVRHCEAAGAAFENLTTVGQNAIERPTDYPIEEEKKTKHYRMGCAVVFAIVLIPVLRPVFFEEPSDHDADGEFVKLGGAWYGHDWYRVVSEPQGQYFFKRSGALAFYWRKFSDSPSASVYNQYLKDLTFEVNSDIFAHAGDTVASYRMNDSTYLYLNWRGVGLTTDLEQLNRPLLDQITVRTPSEEEQRQRDRARREKDQELRRIERMKNQQKHSD